LTGAFLGDAEAEQIVHIVLSINGGHDTEERKKGRRRRGMRESVCARCLVVVWVVT
jgi:hypothetical protein